MAPSPFGGGDGIERSGRFLNLEDMPPGHISVVNESGLPDDDVMGAVQTYWTENASVGGASRSSFGMYANNDGSLLARNSFRPPTNIIEEIKLARDLAERDDDVAAAMGTMIAAAFSEDAKHYHQDETTVALYEEAAKFADLDSVLKEMYREYLIASQFTTISLYTRTVLKALTGRRDQTEIKKQVSIPIVGVLPSEQIRVLDDDTFGNAPLWWKPATEKQDKFLREYHDPKTTAARQAELRRLNPVWAAAFVERIKAPADADGDALLFSVNLTGDWLYRINPRMARRTTMPKGSWAHPRPLLTRNFALLEAKRLLNIMDYSLLQGGTNYIVIAKKGSDKQPGKPAEVANLYNVIRSASRTGVIVGDHRLSLEIVTPDLTELLNPTKRALLGRKLANAMLRIPESSVDKAGVEGIKADMLLLQNVVTGDRSDIRRHVAGIHQATADRNPSAFTKGPATIWLPKIVLSGADSFVQYILKLADRGLISHRATVEAGGFDYDAMVEERRAEIADGDDEVLIPSNVPFDQPNAPGGGAGGGGGLPGDTGRPPGSSRSNGRPGGPPNARGETVRAWFNEEANTVERMGALTYDMLAEYPEWAEGRTTALERAALDSDEPHSSGSIIVVPVNPAYDCENFTAARLEDGLSMIVGRRTVDGAVVAKALCFKEPRWDKDRAAETVARWGFPAGEPNSQS